MELSVFGWHAAVTANTTTSNDRSKLSAAPLKEVIATGRFMQPITLPDVIGAAR
jgi:hypothetical protein